MYWKVKILYWKVEILLHGQELSVVENWCFYLTTLEFHSLQTVSASFQRWVWRFIPVFRAWACLIWESRAVLDLGTLYVLMTVTIFVSPKCSNLTKEGLTYMPLRSSYLFITFEKFIEECLSLQVVYFWNWHLQMFNDCTSCEIETS